MLYEGDIECIEKLLKTAKRIVKKGFSIGREPFEKRVQLWNETKENFDRYEDGECGKFLEDLDMHYRSTFDIALLILDRSFKINNEDFQCREYTDEEFEVYERIEKYNVFEIMSKNDIKKKVIVKDKNILNLFEEYYVHMDQWVEEIIENPDIRITVRYYLKKKWGSYKEKLNEAINELISELDWFRKLVRGWQEEAEARAEEMTGELKDGLEKKQYELEEKEQELQGIIEEIKGMKEKVDRGSRLVDMGEAKFYENNFIGRIKNKLQGEVDISGKKFVVESIKYYKDVDILKYAEDLADRDIRNLPENKYIIARLVEKKILGKKQEILLKAMFCGRTEKFAKYGIDTDPLELSDINPYLSEAMDIADNKKMLLCIASPTGFAKEVEERINGEEFHKNFLSIVSVCLVDMETGKLIINPYDQIAKNFKKICMLEIDKEKEAKTKKCVENMLIEKGHVSLIDAARICGDKKFIKKVFYDLESERGCRVRYIKDIGLVLVGR